MQLTNQGVNGAMVISSAMKLNQLSFRCFLPRSTAGREECFPLKLARLDFQTTCNLRMLEKNVISTKGGFGLRQPVKVIFRNPVGQSYKCRLWNVLWTNESIQIVNSRVSCILLAWNHRCAINYVARTQFGFCRRRRRLPCSGWPGWREWKSLN